MKIIKDYKLFTESVNSNEDEFFTMTKVQLLDFDKISKEIDDSIKKDNNEVDNQDINYNIRGRKLGLCRNLHNQFFLFDIELVGKTFNKNEKVKISVYQNNVVNGEKTIGLFPKYDTSFTLPELLEYVIGEVTIKDFMEDRFNYNSRIEGNMYTFKEWYLSGK